MTGLLNLLIVSSGKGHFVLHGSRCIPRLWGFSSGSRFFVFLQITFGRGHKLQNCGTSEKMRCISLSYFSTRPSQCLLSYLTAISNTYIPGIRFAGFPACLFILVVEAHELLRGRFHGFHGSRAIILAPIDPLKLPCPRCECRREMI